ncbi:MAG: hypothetical protein IH944_11765 [Armatimonadetes bacterium]|nr:hypothetical protein [Armatimonadota bacterium]
MKAHRSFVRSALAVSASLWILFGCALVESGYIESGQVIQVMPNHAPLVANLESSDDGSFLKIRTAFRENNPGYDIAWHAATSELEPEDTSRVVFVQRYASVATVEPDGHSSDIDVGDILILRPGESVSVDVPTDFLAFTVPEPFPDELPTFIRPDWDDNITDVVGGCATETGAYRRILLTWLDSVGPYTYHALNAHRVRITDSFTHYHPIDGGFDEFYLVQMVQPEARIITSMSVDLIEDPGSVTAAQAAGLLAETPLRVGDLVYLPRGMAHRGVDSVLAQVISTPGFRPGAEIGLDHYLRAINERLSLNESDALPYHEDASAEAIVK